MSTEKIALGILGGMGPQATIDLQQKILNLTAAQRDSEHMRVFVDNHPQIPDRIGAILRGTQSPAPAMQESLDKLAAMGASCIVMPCVSAHYFIPECKIPKDVVFIDMLELAAQACASRYPGKKVGVLCTVATAQAGLFTRYLERHSVPCIYPKEEDQQTVGQLILDVKAGLNLTPVAASLHSIAAEMTTRGADYFVLACTEIPIIHSYDALPYPCIDATYELAKAAVLGCGYKITH